MLPVLVVLAGLWASPIALAADHHCPPGSTVLPLAVDGNVIVEPAAFCIGFGSQIKGNVIVLPNATGFHLHGGTVVGNVQSENPVFDIRIFSATVHGSIQIKKTRPGTAGAICRNEIVGDIVLEENQGITTVGIGFPSDVCTGGNIVHGQVKLEKNRFKWDLERSGQHGPALPVLHGRREPLSGAARQPAGLRERGPRRPAQHQRQLRSRRSPGVQEPRPGERHLQPGRREPPVQGQHASAGLGREHHPQLRRAVPVLTPA